LRVDRRSLGARGARRRQARHQVDANGGLTTGQNALWWSALPVSLGIGILKFRLYDIDRIISRMLAYTIVTGLLVGLYAGLSAWLRELGGETGPF
jgi:hypothetical protein